MPTKLNLPSYPFRLKQVGDKVHIFDSIRKKFITLTPEEWVRQHIVRYLTDDRKFPASLIAIECGLTINGLKMRSDIVAYNKKGRPVLIVECKAPEVKISQQVFDQIARYNLQLQVDYLVVSNGLNHYCCKMNYKEQTYDFIPEFPDYSSILCE
ncbi:MAG: type I restriction enzyme HsdR N-terminal domain-containing protein [Bacteroidota bacterium]|nr:type I restriction enzyme HsdR N-terminal domain-containing protein [Bacteroidota bacterium]MDP4204561.1 type I restriction enzyme HsdR N-terminal domain-containing protein [Bacteroidota bacterium]